MGAGVDVHIGIRPLPLTQQQITSVKVVDTSKGLAMGFTFDVDGFLLSDNGRKLRRNEAESHREVFGAISPGLLVEIAETQSGQPLPVAIWLNVHEEYLDKSALLGDEAQLAYCRMEHSARIDSLQNAFREAALAIVPYETVAKIHFVPDVPAATGALSVGEIFSLQALPDVAAILYNPAPVSLAYGDDSFTWVSTVQSDLVVPDGTGFPVCVIEECTPENGGQFLEVVGIFHEGFGQCLSEHAGLVCGAVRNSHPADPNGVAQGSGCYFANFGHWDGQDFADLYQQLGPAVYGGCVQGNYYIWTYQYTSTRFIDMYFDYLVKHPPFPVVTMAAGNWVDDLDTLGWNVLSVGATDDANTTDRSDDIIWDDDQCPFGDGGSASINPPSDDNKWSWDQELPLLVAPGSNISVMGTAASGTSLAAPMVAGVATIMMEANSELVGWPEAVRSILMATATNDVDGTFLDSDDCWRHDNGTWDCGDVVGPGELRERDDRDGAGEVNAFLASILSGNGFRVEHDSDPQSWGFDYGWMSYSQEFNGDNSWWAKNYYVAANDWEWPIRIALSWDASVTCYDDEDPTYCFSPSYLLDFDLDLYVFEMATGAIVATSLSQSNSYEFVQFIPAPGHTYRIAVKLYEHNHLSTYFGLAWATWPFADND